MKGSSNFNPNPVVVGGTGIGTSKEFDHLYEGGMHSYIPITHSQNELNTLNELNTQNTQTPKPKSEMKIMPREKIQNQAQAQNLDQGGKEGNIDVADTSGASGNSGSNYNVPISVSSSQSSGKGKKERTRTHREKYGIVDGSNLPTTDVIQAARSQSMDRNEAEEAKVERTLRGLSYDHNA